MAESERRVAEGELVVQVDDVALEACRDSKIEESFNNVESSLGKINNIINYQQ